MVQQKKFFLKFKELFSLERLGDSGFGLVLLLKIIIGLQAQNNITDIRGLGNAKLVRPLITIMNVFKENFGIF